MKEMRTHYHSIKAVSSLNENESRLKQNHLQYVEKNGSAFSLTNRNSCFLLLNDQIERENRKGRQ